MTPISSVVTRHRAAAYWYIDNSVSSSGNGETWATAWKDFSDIVWGSVVGGDTIRISGGVSGQTYNTSVLTIGTSGTAGNQITITGSTENGYNGPVVLDGSSTTTINSSSAIVANGSNYTNWTLQNVTLQNTLENCLYISGITSGTVIVQNVTIHTGLGIVSFPTNAATAAGNATLHFASLPTGITSSPTEIAVNDSTTTAAIPIPTLGSSATSTTFVMANDVVTPGVADGDVIDFACNARGIRIGQCSSCQIIVRNCTVDTPDSTISQTDTVFTYLNTGTVLITNNRFTVNNTDPSGHSDCWQAQEDGGVVFCNNVLSHPSGGVNNHGIIITDVAAAGIQVYDNIIIMEQSLVGFPETAILLQTEDSGYTGICDIYNNTIYGGLYAVQLAEPNGYHATWNFENNIIYGTGITEVPYAINQSGLTFNTSHNVVFMGGTDLRLTGVSGGDGSSRSTATLAGKTYFEVQFGMNLSSQNTQFGVGNASQSMSTVIGTTAPAYSMGYDWANGRLYMGNSWTYAVGEAAAGDILGVAVDPTNELIWITNLTTGTGWNAGNGSQNPATGTGGISFSSVTGPYYVMGSVGNTADYIVFNFGASSFFGTVPSGFTAASSLTLDPANVGTGASLSAFIALNNGTWQTWAAWQTAGGDASSVNSDPLFQSNGVNFELQSGSPAINAGATLTGVPVDFAGYTRPQGTSYCIGAYEYPI